MTRNAVIDAITSLVSTPLPHPDALLSLAGDLADAVSVQYPDSEFARDYEAPRHNTIAGHVHMALGHISADPVSTHRAHLLRDSYVYAESSHAIDPYAVNANPDSAAAFIDSLVAEAREEHAVYASTSHRPKSVYVLSGERGIGKTCFLNHLLTKHHEALLVRKILWARIHLPDGFGSDTPDLAHWLRSKVAQVILKYVPSAHPDFRGFLDGVRQRVERELGGTLPDLYRHNIDVLRTSFSSGRGEALGPHSVAPLVAHEVLAELHSRGYAVIYVLDGFDKIDITPRFEKRFLSLLDDIRRAVSNSTKLNGAFVVACRKNTLTYFTGNKPFGTEDHVNTEFRHITYIRFERILEHRLEVVSQSLPRLAPDMGFALHEWQARLKEFNTEWDALLRSGFIENSPLDVEHYYGNNNRAKCQMLQLAFYRYMVKEDVERRYLLVELMTKGGFLYPPRVYAYAGSPDGTLAPQAVTKLFDNVFLPTIGAFPYSDGYKYPASPAGRTYLLASVRVMQVIRECTRRASHHRLSPMVSVKLVTDILGRFLDYDPAVTSRICDELCEAGLIELIGEGMLVPNRTQARKAILMPKLATILGSGVAGSSLGVLGEVAYLNLCAMRCLVPRAAVEDGGGPPLFRATRLEPDPARVSAWARTKILNGISMLRVMSAVDELEMQHLDDVLKSTPKDTINRPVVESIRQQDLIRHVRVAATKQLERIAVTLAGDDQTALQRSLNAYRTRWA